MSLHTKSPTTVATMEVIKSITLATITAMATIQMDPVTKGVVTTTTRTMIQSAGFSLDLEKSKNFTKFYGREEMTPNGRQNR